MAIREIEIGLGAAKLPRGECEDLVENGFGRTTDRLARDGCRGTRMRPLVERSLVGVDGCACDPLGIQLEYTSHNAAKGLRGTLPHIDRSTIDDRAAVRGDLDARLRETTLPTAVLEADRQSLAAREVGFVRIVAHVPFDSFGQQIQSCYQIGINRAVAHAIGFTRQQQIASPDFQGIDPEPTCDHVDLALRGPGRLRAAEAAIGAGRYGIGADS